MTVFKFILYTLAIFVTLLWIMKMIGDVILTIYGGPHSQEDATKDGLTRIIFITIMSVLWALIITLS